MPWGTVAILSVTVSVSVSVSLYCECIVNKFNYIIWPFASKFLENHSRPDIMTSFAGAGKSHLCKTFTTFIHVSVNTS